MQVGRVRWDFQSAHPQVVQTKKSEKLEKFKKIDFSSKTLFFPKQKNRKRKKREKNSKTFC